MLLAELSDSVWNAIITGSVAVGLAWIAYRTKALEAKVEKNADAAEDKLERIAVVTDANHELSNSAFLANLKTIAELLMDRAKSSGNPEDLKIAHEAVSHYETHKKTQNNINKNAVGEKIEPASDLKRRQAKEAGATTHVEDVVKAGEDIKSAGQDIAAAGDDIASAVSQKGSERRDG